jgi:hypothetical protein
MANSFEFADWLSMEALRLLTNPLEISTAFNTNYNSEFTQDFAVGDTVRVPFPKQFIAGNTDLSYQPQPIIDRHATIAIDKVAKVHFEWDSVERALKMPKAEEKISRDIIRPAMLEMRQEFENQCALHALMNTPNIVGQLGTNPTTFDAVYGAAGQRMQELGVWTGEKKMFLTPGVARALRASAVSYFNPADELTRMWKTGSIGEANGFDTYSTMSLYPHTAGTWAGTVEILTAPVSGATTLSLTATTGDTFKKGDVFNIAGVYEVNPQTRKSTGTLKQFKVAANVTAAASAATITLVAASSAGAIIGPGSPYQNVDALPVAGADLTLFPGTTTPNGKVGTASLAIGRDAFGLVGVKLANPKQAEMSSFARDPKSGLSVSFLRMFDPVQRKWINRFDSIFGIGNFYNDRAAVLVLGA